MPRFKGRSYSSSISLNGTNNPGIIIPNAVSLNPTAAFTLEMWVKPWTFDSAVLIDNSTVGVTNSYFVSMDTNLKLSFFCTIGGVAKNIPASTAVLKMREWNLFHVTYDGAQISIMLNGAQFSTLAATGAVGTNSGPLRIGQYFTGTLSNPRANIGSTRIYSRALTFQDHKDRYYEDRDDSAMRTDIVLDMPMSEGSGTAVADFSGNANHGVYATGTWSTDTPYKGRTVAATNRLAIRHLPFSISNNGGGQIAKTAPTGLPTGPTPRSISVKVYYNDDTIATLADLHSNGVASFSPTLGFISGLYYWFSDRVNATANLTLTRAEFYSGVGVRKWREITYTYDGNLALKLYVDGIIFKSASLTVPINAETVDTLLFGSGLTSTQTPLYRLNGYIQDCFVFNTELTATEVSRKYFEDYIPPSAVTRIKANEGTGTTAADSIGSNSCTLSGTTADWSSAYSMFKERTVSSSRTLIT